MPALFLCSDSPHCQPRAVAARSRSCHAGGTATACCQGLEHGSHLPVCCPRWGHGGERGGSVGLRRRLVGTVQRGEGLNLTGLGTVELGCSTSGWTQPCRAGWRRETLMGRHGKSAAGPHSRKVHGASRLQAGGDGGIRSHPLPAHSPALRRPPRRGWRGTEGLEGISTVRSRGDSPSPAIPCTSACLPPQTRGWAARGRAAQLCILHPHPAPPASLPASPASFPASRPACRIPPLRGRRPVI